MSLDRNGLSWFDKAAFAFLGALIGIGLVGLAWLTWGPT